MCPDAATSYPLASLSSCALCSQPTPNSIAVKENEKKMKYNLTRQMVGFMTIKTGNLVHSPIYNLREPWHLLFIPIQRITTQERPGNILGKVFILGWQSKVGMNSYISSITNFYNSLPL